MSREAFQALLDRKPDIQIANAAFVAARHNVHRQAFAAKYLARDPKFAIGLPAYWDKPRKLDSELVDRLIAEDEEAAATAWAEHSDIMDAWKAEVAKMANALDVLPGDEWLRVESVFTGAYNSQTDKAKYAEVRAELYADEYRARGLEVEVVRRFGEAYDVNAKVSSALDVTIVKYSDAKVPLRDMVAACWRRGANPRVYWYWLPHGYEAKEGISWQGVLNEPTKVTDAEFVTKFVKSVKHGFVSGHDMWVLAGEDTGKATMALRRLLSKRVLQVADVQEDPRGDLIGARYTQGSCYAAYEESDPVPVSPSSRSGAEPSPLRGAPAAKGGRPLLPPPPPVPSKAARAAPPPPPPPRRVLGPPGRS